VVYDPGWDMPRINWQQQGSFETGEIPLAFDPDAGPLICLPPINVHWLPLILGCLDQLRNPSTWITSSDASLNTILDRANRLMQMVGERAPCFMYQLRFTSSCVLQFSTDGGATWTDVDGWDANFANCVAGVIIPPIPPNPGPSPIDQHACNIAGYIATEIIQLSITTAVNDFNAHVAQIQYAQDILLTVAYAFPLTALALDAFAVLYGEYTALTIGDFTTASTDPVLWGDITCAIYEAIRTTGYIDAANVGTVVSNICAISYTSSTVITAICNFVGSLQLQDWQAFQNVGAFDDVDCFGCASPPGWCYEFSAAKGTWTIPPLEDALPYGSGPFSRGSIVSGSLRSNFYIGAVQALDPGIHNLTSTTLRHIHIEYQRLAAAGSGDSYLKFGPETTPASWVTIGLQTAAGTYVEDHVISPGHVMDFWEIGLDSSTGVSTNYNYITVLRFSGTGTNPFGTSNC
jgi:hypothetical protein